MGTKKEVRPSIVLLYTTQPRLVRVSRRLVVTKARGYDCSCMILVLLEWVHYETWYACVQHRCAMLFGRQLGYPLFNVRDSSELQIQFVLFTVAVMVSLV